MATHDLKTWPKYFEAVRSQNKTFEFRYNDRDFEVGDTLCLLEWQPDADWDIDHRTRGYYTGRTEWRTITFILAATDDFTQPEFVPDDWVIMAIKPVG